MMVGEIGISRHEFLYELDLWEINAIIRGYRKRAHAIWESSRLTTFSILCAMGAKLSSPKDLWQLPWEREATIISKEQTDQLKQLLDDINANLDNTNSDEKH